MARREKRIETNVNKKALRELRVPNIPLKLLLGAETGWPDRLYLIGFGQVLFIEYKDPDKGEVSPKQQYMINLLKEIGYNVQVHDNEDEAFEAIARAKVEAARISAQDNEVHASTSGRDRSA